MSPLKSDFNELGSVIFFISFVYNNENLPILIKNINIKKSSTLCALNFNCDMIKKKKGIKTMIEMNAFFCYLSESYLSFKRVNKP